MKKIIAIDDNEAILEVIKIALEEAGYQVETSTKGLTFVPRIVEVRPDVVLLDLLLSGEDGRDVAKCLKSQKETKDIPIIMLSAHPSAEKAAKDSGIDDFIAKPFDLNQLLKKLDIYTNLNGD